MLSNYTGSILLRANFFLNRFKNLYYWKWMYTQFFLLMFLCNVSAKVSLGRHFPCSTYWKTAQNIILCCSLGSRWHTLTFYFFPSKRTHFGFIYFQLCSFFIVQKIHYFDDHLSEFQVQSIIPIEIANNSASVTVCVKMGCVLDKWPTCLWHRLGHHSN